MSDADDVIYYPFFRERGTERGSRMEIREVSGFGWFGWVWLVGYFIFIFIFLREGGGGWGEGSLVSGDGDGREIDRVKSDE